ncbi:MAG: carbamoyltransferase C-terminal domain-containing protein [Pseudomonadota bacterium]
MNILGLNCYGHDSAATLLRNGSVAFAVEEERLNRIKHSGAFPEEAIREALLFCGLSFSEIDHVAFSWDPKITYAKIPLYLMRYWKTLPILLRERGGFSMEENLGMFNYLKDIRNIPKKLEEIFLNKQKGQFKFHLLEHHLCHAASCFYPSGFDEAAILTIDGAGEWSTTMLAHGRGNKITKLRTVETPHSLGAFYQAISRHLGFKLIEGPGKLMGLASYGNRNSKEYKKLAKLIRLLPSGGFEIDMSYFAYHYSRKNSVTQKFIEEFGPANSTGGEWSERELNLATAAQHIVEDVVLHLIGKLSKTFKSPNLCMAGGVALNSVTNGLIAKSGIYESIFIQPAAGDSGTSLGGALLVEHGILGRPREHPQRDSFLGPEYKSSDYQVALEEVSLSFERMPHPGLFDYAAKKICDGEIVAWFQGRMEFGPRALGNRSFLATPLKKEMKDILNARVKFREGFRPFAAIVLEEDVGRYFDCAYQNPYMLFVYHVKEEYRHILPSITHVDNSVRIQTVNQQENPDLYALLKAFKRLTGHSVIINTSFNIKGEPIVCSPRDAVNSFNNADVDVLIMGDFVSTK